MISTKELLAGFPALDEEFVLQFDQARNESAFRAYKEVQAHSDVKNFQGFRPDGKRLTEQGQLVVGGCIIYDWAILYGLLTKQYAECVSADTNIEELFSTLLWAVVDDARSVFRDATNGVWLHVAPPRNSEELPRLPWEMADDDGDTLNADSVTGKKLGDALYDRLQPLRQQGIMLVLRNRANPAESRKVEKSPDERGGAVAKNDPDTKPVKKDVALARKREEWLLENMGDMNWNEFVAKTGFTYNPIKNYREGGRATANVKKGIGRALGVDWTLVP